VSKNPTNCQLQPGVYLHFTHYTIVWQISSIKRELNIWHWRGICFIKGKRNGKDKWRT